MLLQGYLKHVNEYVVFGVRPKLTQTWIKEGVWDTFKNSGGGKGGGCEIVCPNNMTSDRLYMFFRFL